MKIGEFTDCMNSYASAGTPFIFLIDFEMKNPFVCRLEDAKEHNLIFDVKDISNYEIKKRGRNDFLFQPHPITREDYNTRIEKVKMHIRRGDTYLLNLTFPTPIESELSIEELFAIARAPYKLLYMNKVLIFSPECFIKIRNGEIYSYPMKGTIDASIPDAEKIIIEDKKEFYEHNTIVDLIRNDLSMVSEYVRVSKFRYLERIPTNHNELIQVSSEIQGTLPDEWRSRLGDIILTLLPAGSISGAPKQKTVEIIREVETQERGYYTGIFGLFNGTDLDSAVNIRYIEKRNNKLFYHSGGGITAFSDSQLEYDELLSKIYVPTI